MSIQLRACWPLALLGLWLVAAGPVTAQSQKQAKAAADAAAATALEPTRDDLLRAYGARITEVNDGAGAVLAADETAQVRLTLEDAQKLTCERIQQDGLHYDCRVEARLRIADQRPRTSVVHLWMEKTDTGWVSR